MKPAFPIYIPSKSRADIATTPRVLDQMRVPYRLIVEEQQYAAYSAAFGPSRLLVLDRGYQERYETCDDLGLSKPVGPGAARNFAWDHSVSEGHEWHWVADDNIQEFGRLHRNHRILDGDGHTLRAMEDFCLRYLNVGMAGPQYRGFLPSRAARRDPFTLNTRVFSCNLIRNDTEVRWRGRYNEDLALSIEMLKAGWCTILFSAFFQQKAGTQRMKGGNMDAFYQQGTLAKSQMAVSMYPDMVTLKMWRGRWHHDADFSQFRDMRLIRDPEWTPGRPRPELTTAPNPHFRQRRAPKDITAIVEALCPEHASRAAPGWDDKRKRYRRA